MSNLNLPAKQIGTVLDLFESPNVQSQIQRALPEFLTVDKLTRITITVMRQNPGLVKCSQQSLLACFFACAQLGLTPEPWLGLCYFVPFWSTKLNCMESTFIPGYRGLIELMRRAGSVIDVDGKAVYQNEPFEVEFGLEPKLRHSIADGDPGEFRGAYCKFLHSATDISFDYMSKWEVDKIMARTKSRNKKKEIVGPWVTDYPAMAIKTVIRRHSKYKSKSVEDQSYQKAMHAETVADQLGPESQRQLFLPDAGPVEPVYSAADFDVEYSEITGHSAFTAFFEVARAANTPEGEPLITDDEVKVMAVGNPEGPQPFRSAFLNWVETNRAKPKAKAKAKPKSKPKAKSKAKPKEAVAMTGDIPVELTGDDLYQTDEWQELMFMRDEWSEIYLEVVGDTEPKKLSEVVKVVDAINEKLTD